MNTILNINNAFRTGLVMVGLFALPACGDDGTDSDDGSDVGATQGQGTTTAGTSTGGTGYVCDPVGANPDMGQLLNASVGSDVQVVVKQPQHPGQPGPTNLP